MATPFALKASMVAGGVATVSGLGSVAYISTWTTIGDKLQKDQLTLISEEEDYKIVLFNNKESSDLKTAISQTGINYSQHISNIKQWCEGKVKEWFSSDKDKTFLNAKAWCTVPKIKLLGDKLENKLHEGTAWQTKFAEFSKESNGNNKFLEALNVGVDRDKLTKDSQNGGDKLRDWCNSAVKLKIYESDQHKTETNVRNWCLSNKKK